MIDIWTQQRVQRGLRCFNTLHALNGIVGQDERQNRTCDKIMNYDMYLLTDDEMIKC